MRNESNDLLSLDRVASREPIEMLGNTSCRMQPSIVWRSAHYFLKLLKATTTEHLTLKQTGFMLLFDCEVTISSRLILLIDTSMDRIMNAICRVVDVAKSV